jgi:hypothetical protein
LAYAPSRLWVCEAFSCRVRPSKDEKAHKGIKQKRGDDEQKNAYTADSLEHDLPHDLGQALFDPCRDRRGRFR